MKKPQPRPVETLELLVMLQLMMMMKGRITTIYQVSLCKSVPFHMKNFAVLLVNSPINSTQVDHSTSEAGSHHNLELSRIEPAGASLPTRADGGTTAAMSSAARPPTLGSLLPTAAPPLAARDLTSLIEEDMILTSIRSANDTSNPQGVYHCQCEKNVPGLL